ncbi:MAG: ADP-ribosylglycohydrolase family protein, partial [Myxococcales bacterium]|nr:ADP-ribosylglycohydrolase family protein [Myxococcales bacterium]
MSTTCHIPASDAGFDPAVRLPNNLSHNFRNGCPRSRARSKPVTARWWGRAEQPGSSACCGSVETSRIEVLQGALVGTAVGDSLGLPYEGMSRRRVRRMVGGRRLRHRFALGRGMVSDDTDHACLVALALLRAQGDSQVFARVLARSLRWWLAGLPAGVGLGTLRAILKLWVGFGADRSGVWSAGNGPAMRAPIIGAYASGD